MKTQALSALPGTPACNADCEFCIAHQTGSERLPRSEGIDAEGVDDACSFAVRGGTTSFLLTGKGEPTLYPDDIDEYLDLATPWKFPSIELQTNALDIGWLANDGVARDQKEITIERLQQWRRKRLRVIAISVVDVESGPNKETYLHHRKHEYPDLTTTIRFLHALGFTIRLCVMMRHGAVVTPADVQRVLDFCREHQVEQLTMRPLRKAEKPVDKRAARYVEEHGLTIEEERAIQRWIVEEKKGTPMLFLMHGAVVYDVDGQNLCLNDCLTVNAKEDGDSIRTLIVHPDGELRYDWQHPGAVIFGGRRRRPKDFERLLRPNADP